MDTVAFATVESLEGELDTEAVGVEVEGETVRLYLDDGRTLAFDRRANYSQPCRVQCPKPHPELVQGRLRQ
jgi:hypothetical protein